MTLKISTRIKDNIFSSQKTTRKLLTIGLDGRLQFEIPNEKNDAMVDDFYDTCGFKSRSLHFGRNIEDNFLFVGYTLLPIINQSLFHVRNFG